MEVSRSTQLKKLKQEVSRRIIFLQHKAVIDYREVYQLIREFFKSYLERPYEFTISELREEIRGTYVPITVRDDVNDLLTTIEHMEYRSVTYSRQGLQEILEKFSKVVEELIKTTTRKQSFFEKLRRFIFQEEEPPLFISELPVLENDEAQHVHLNMLLERTYIFIDKNKTKAKRQYKELLTYYDQAPDDIKREFFPLIDEAYKALK